MAINFDSRHVRLLAGLLLLTGCSGSGAGSGLAIVASSGGPLQGVAGDALALKVVQDGAQPLPAGATVAWSGATLVTALDPSSMAPSPLPSAGAQPTAAFITNPGRPDLGADLASVLFILDPGTVQSPSLEITATVSGSLSGTATASIPVSATPAGDATRGAALYGTTGANCAACHGPTAHGAASNPDGSFTLDGMSYSYAAPGLNAEMGNVASDPDWSAALLAMASRSDMDNGGLTLRVPMPDELTTPSASTGQPLATQDFADIYAFLKTQSH